MLCTHNAKTSTLTHFCLTISAPYSHVSFRPSESNTPSPNVLPCVFGSGPRPEVRRHLALKKKKKKPQSSFQTQRDRESGALHNRAIPVLCNRRGWSHEKNTSLRALLGRPYPTFCYQPQNPRWQVRTVGLAGKLPSSKV